LNIAIGLTGMLDLGYVTNYAVGAYTMAVMTSTSELGRGGGVLNFWLVIPIAVILAMATRFLLTLPILKMRGDYLAIATLGFGEIIGTLANSDWLAPLVGGAQGVLFVPKPNFFGITLVDPEQLYYVVLVACGLFLFISLRLSNSRIGRQWMAVREDEDVARAMGIDVTRSKLLALTLAAAAGGLAGAIFAAKVGTVFPNSFTLFVSINVLALIIVGGLGSIPGIVLGALALVGLPDLLREFSEYRFLIYGALLIFMMLNRPEGLLPSQVTRRELHTDDETSPAPQAAAGD
jgi:branched-chain amino acid transport system permease protein